MSDSSKTVLRFRTLGRYTGPGTTADTIAPSCYLLDVVKNGVIKRRIMVDCGANPIREEAAIERSTTPDFAVLQDGRKVDVLIITHAHQDHIGGLVYLAMGDHLAPGARIIMTVPTVEVVREMYRRELEMEGWRRREGKPSTKDYDVNVLVSLMNRFHGLKAEGEYALFEDVTMLVQSAGHITGACSFTLRIGSEVIHYTGDWCLQDQPILRGARPLPANWQPTIVAGSDCTYGAETSDSRGNFKAELDRMVQYCYDRIMLGYRVVFSTFALHRAGLIADTLNKAGVGSAATLMMDGQSAIGYADLFASGKYLWSAADRPLDLKGIWKVSGRRERYQFANEKGAKVVVAPSGMGGPGYPGAGTFWRQEIIEDENATLIFTGYLAPDSDGAKIVQAAERREQTGETEAITFRETNEVGGIWHDVTYQLKCKVMRFRLGGHNSRDATVQWFRGVDAPIMVLSHGCPAALASLAGELAASGCTGRIMTADKEPEFEIELDEAA